MPHAAAMAAATVNFNLICIKPPVWEWVERVDDSTVANISQFPDPDHRGKRTTRHACERASAVASRAPGIEFVGKRLGHRCTDNSLDLLAQRRGELSVVFQHHAGD